MASTIYIIGLGVSVPAELNAASELALLNCDVVVGSPRQFELVEKLLDKKEAIQRIELPKLAALKGLIDQIDQQNIAVLATGDPLFYGIGRWFSQNLSSDRLRFYPAVSSIQMACHRMGLALQDVQVVSLHGRPVSNLRRHLKQNQTLLLLTDNASHPAALAGACIEAGFADSLLTICENLGYSDEKIQTRNVVSIDSSFDCSALNICVIQPAGTGNVLPEFPGFDDRLFVTDGESGQGMISKREVRLNILSSLQPTTGDVIWDVGAGCGGVSTELAYWNERTTVYAIEQHAERLNCLNQNRVKFGVTANLNIVEGRAPEALENLPLPNKVFIGGSGGELKALLDKIWGLLPDGGLLVATAVTNDTLAQLEYFARKRAKGQFEAVRLSIARGQVSKSINYQEKLPVTLFNLCKLRDTS